MLNKITRLLGKPHFGSVVFQFKNTHYTTVSEGQAHDALSVSPHDAVIFISDQKKDVLVRTTNVQKETPESEHETRLSVDTEDVRVGHSDQVEPILRNYPRLFSSPAQARSQALQHVLNTIQSVSGGWGEYYAQILETRSVQDTLIVAPWHYIIPGSTGARPFYRPGQK